MTSKKKIKSLCSSCPHWIDYEEKTMVFSFRYLGKSVFCSLDDKDLKALFNQLELLSSLSWKQIKQSRRHGLGTEKIDVSAISAAIPTNIANQDVTFLALRYKGKAPMVGFRERDIFHIVWIDRDFTLYAHS